MESRQIAAALGVALLSAIVCAGCATTTEGVASAPALRILLCNDDGYLSPGIRAVRAALEHAGHDVVLVAPLENRSGASSSSSTSGSLALREEGPNTWSVGGTPADAVRVGLSVVLREAPPDLVVSGANFGQNIGPSTLQSGTVGAALTAMSLGYPAIAISVGIDPSEMRSTPRFESTIAAFDDAASFVVRTIRELQATRAADGSDSLLPDYTVLNINYPAREAAQVAGVAWANIGRAAHFGVGFEREGSDSVRVVFQSAEGEESVRNADTTLFDAGYVTLTLLDGDLIAPSEVGRDVDLRLGDIAP